MMPYRRSLFDEIDPETGMPITRTPEPQEPQVPEAPLPDYSQTVMNQDDVLRMEQDPAMSPMGLMQQAQQQPMQGQQSALDQYSQGAMPPQDDMMLGPNAALQGAQGAGYEAQARDSALAADKAASRNAKLEGLARIANGFAGGGSNTPVDVSGIRGMTARADRKAGAADEALARYNASKQHQDEVEYGRRYQGVQDTREAEERKAASAESLRRYEQDRGDKDLDDAAALKENSRQRYHERRMQQDRFDHEAQKASQPDPEKQQKLEMERQKRIQLGIDKWGEKYEAARASLEEHEAIRGDVEADDIPGIGILDRDKPYAFRREKEIEVPQRLVGIVNRGVEAQKGTQSEGDVNRKREEMGVKPDAREPEVRRGFQTSYEGAKKHLDSIKANIDPDTLAELERRRSVQQGAGASQRAASMSAEDKQALDWATRNPQAPQAKSIIENLKRKGLL